MDSIFSERFVGSQNREYGEELSVWEDVPIVNLDPHMNAARFVLGMTRELDNFFDFEIKLKSPMEFTREEVEERLKRAYGRLGRWLRRRFPVIQDLDRDRLLLEEGNILCCIAKLENKRWIPVLMPEHVAQKWDARPTEALDAVVRKEKRDAFYTPILHERYRRFPVSREGTRRLDLIREFIGPTGRRLTLLDIGCNTGFYMFHFFRQGFEVCGIDIDESHLGVAKALTETYSSPVRLENSSLQDFRHGQRFDIALGLTVFYHMLGWGEVPTSITPDVLGNKLDELVGHALFWEGGRRADEEIDLIKSNSMFKFYKSLGRTDATGISDREFGVFTRIPSDEARSWFRDGALQLDARQ